MARTQQSVAGNRAVPIYVSAESWPECFKFKPADELTLIWDAPDVSDAAQVNYLNDRKLEVRPNDPTDETQFLADREPLARREWQGLVVTHVSKRRLPHETRELRAVVHNIADSLAGGVGSMIGVCELDVPERLRGR